MFASSEAVGLIVQLFGFCLSLLEKGFLVVSRLVFFITVEYLEQTVGTNYRSRDPRLDSPLAQDFQWHCFIRIRHGISLLSVRLILASLSTGQVLWEPREASTISRLW